MLHLVTGPAQSGKSEYIFRQMKALAASKQASLLIVPESYSHQAERRMLKVCGNAGGQYAHVTTFSKLARELLQEAGLRPQTLDNGGRVLFMYQALEACQGALRYFRGAPKPQLIARLLETMDELAAGQVTPQSLLEAAEVGQLPDKVRDLGLIYSAYSAAVQSGGLDPREPFEIACGVIGQSAAMAGLHVFVDGFSGFTALRRQALGLMLTHCAGLTVSLLLGTDRVLFTQQEKTRDQLLRLAEQVGVQAKTIALEPHGSRPLAALAAAAFDYGTPAAPVSAEALRVYSCTNALLECELAAGLARRLVLEQGLRARQIALVCADMDTYGPLLENAFGRYGVPFFQSRAEDILQKPPMLAVLGAVEAIHTGLSTQSVMAWLKSGLVGPDTTQRDKLENYALLWNIRGNAWLRPFTLATTGYRNPAPDEAERLAELEGIRQQVAGPLAALQAAFRACTCGREYAAALAQHLEATQLAARLEQRMARLSDSGQPRLAMQYGQMLDIIHQALEQLGSVLGNQPLPLEDFLRLLRLCLSQYSVDTIPASLDAAVACTFERLPMSGVSHIFILGAREGLLPARTGGASLLSEAERIALEGAGVVLTQSADEKAFEAQSYIYRALAVGDRLVITAPQIDVDGSECRPSYLLRRIQAMANAPTLDGARALAALRLSAPAPAIEQACRAQTAPDAAALAARAHLSATQQNRDFFFRLERWARAPRAPINDPALVRRLYGDVLPMTASRVENIASCRFSYFMQYGLKAQARREARFGAPEIGTFVHEVVERTIRDLCQNPQADLAATANVHIDAFMQQAFTAQRVTARLKGILDALSASVIGIVQNVWEEICAGDFSPMWFELDFSQNGDMPPLTVQAGDVAVQVRGKIDRVDGWIDGDTLYLKVVDYKTGRKTFRLSDVYYGLNLQMFLYLSMLGQGGVEQLNRRALAALGREADDVQPGGALYVPAKAPWGVVDAGMSAQEVNAAIDKEMRRVGIVSSQRAVLEAMERPGEAGFRFLPVAVNKDGSLAAKASVADAEQMGALIGRTRKILAELARSIAAGDIAANPYRKGQDHTACDWCDFKAACHFDPTLKTDRHRYLKPLGDAEVYERIRQEETSDGH